MDYLRFVSNTINQAIVSLARRAERQQRETLVETFVDAGDLFSVLSSKDHQVVSGRRGTGKTHVLTYLAEYLASEEQIAIQLDLRTVGSSTSIYNDPRLSQAERGSRLLKDVLTEVHDQLLTLTLTKLDEGASPGLDLAITHLDRLADDILQVEVVGEVATEVSIDVSEGSSSEAAMQVGSAGLDARLTSASHGERAVGQKTTETGTAVNRVHFGAVRSHIENILDGLEISRLWLLLDEWSEIPMDIQPLLADFIKRALLPINRLTVKIALIEHRSLLSDPAGTFQDRVGFEIGADIAADCDLDQYMVFGNDADASRSFFGDLAYKHVAAALGEDAPANPNDFVAQAFTQRPALDELVRAAEGVPRDFINIAMKASRNAKDKKISVPDIRKAAREWYLKDKESSISAEGKRLLHWIIDEVIGGRRARAFLLRQDSPHIELISELYDGRVLHVIKRGVSSRDQAGIRYDVYQIDYGCYVELQNTSRATQGLLEVTSADDDEHKWIEVPADDYRSIRRAILDLDEFAKT